MSNPKTINIHYSSIDKEDIENVVLCSNNDPDYQNFLSFITRKNSEQLNPTQKQEDHYNENKETYDLFETVFRQVYNENVRIEEAQIDKKCSNCTYSRPDSYRPNIPDAYCCWLKYREGLQFHPDKIYGSNKACNEYFEGYVLHHVKLKTLDNDEVLCSMSLKKYEVDTFKESLYEEDEEKKLQKQLSFSYNMVDQKNTVNYGRLKSVLKFFYGYNFSFNIGREAKKLEEGIFNFFKGVNVELLPKILKIKKRSSLHPQYKIMDVCFFSNNIYYIIEVFTSRSLEEKIGQINDYEFLLQKTGRVPIRKILVTDKIYSDFCQPSLPFDICYIDIDDLQKCFQNGYCSGVPPSNDCTVKPKKTSLSELWGRKND